MARVNVRKLEAELRETLEGLDAEAVLERKKLSGGVCRTLSAALGQDYDVWTDPSLNGINYKNYTLYVARRID